MPLAQIVLHSVVFVASYCGLLFAIRRRAPSGRGLLYEETFDPDRSPFKQLLVFVAPLAFLIVMIAMDPQHPRLMYWLHFPIAVQVLAFAPRWKLSMGKDGFCVRRLWRRRFVPWSDFEYFEQRGHRIRVKTKGGFVPVGSSRTDDPMQLSRIEAQVEALRPQHAVPRAPKLRHADDASRWLARRQGEFRTSGPTPEFLLSLVLDPRTTPEVRKTLANALGPSALSEASKSTVSPRSLKTLAELVARSTWDTRGHSPTPA